MDVRASLNNSRFQILPASVHLVTPNFRRCESLAATAFAVTPSRTVRVMLYLQCTALRTDGRHDCCRPVPTAVCVLINVFCIGCIAVSHAGVMEQICIQNDLTLVIYCLSFRSFSLLNAT